MADLGQTLEDLKRDPASDAAASAVRTHAREHGDLRTYAEAFSERGRHLLERGLVDEAISSMLEAAQVYEEEIEDLEAAAALYSRVLDVRGDHRRALFALSLLLHDLGKFEALIDLYRRRLSMTRDEGETTTLYLYIAEILSDRLNNHHRAFQEVMKASRLAPRNLRIIDRLESLGERTNRLDEVAVVLGDLILHQTDPKVRAALSARLGELYMQKLRDPERALACFRSALADDGGNAELLSGLDQLFRTEERFGQLAELLEELTHDRRSGPHHHRLCRELARIYERELSDHKRALAAVVRAAKASPDDRELLDEVLRIGLSSGDLDAVVSTFNEAAAQSANPLLRIYLRLKLGHLLGVVLDRPEEAAESYRAILAIDSEHKEARRRLAKLYERLGRWTKLVLLLEEEADRAPSVESELVILRRIGEIQAAHLEDDASLRSRISRRIQELDPEEARPAPRLPSTNLPSVGASRIAGSSEPTEIAAGVSHEAETEFTGERRVAAADPLDAIEVDEIDGALDGGAFFGEGEDSAVFAPIEELIRGRSTTNHPLYSPGGAFLAPDEPSERGDAVREPKRSSGTEELESVPPPPNWSNATKMGPPAHAETAASIGFETGEIAVAAVFPIVRGERLTGQHVVPEGLAQRPSALPPPEWPPREIDIPITSETSPAAVVPQPPSRPSQAPAVARIRMNKVAASEVRPSVAPPSIDSSQEPPSNVVTLRPSMPPRASVVPPPRPSMVAPRPSLVPQPIPTAPERFSAPPPPQGGAVSDDDRVKDLSQRLADATRRVDVTEQIEILEEITALHSDRGEADRALVAAMRLVRLAPNEERVRRLLALAARAEAEAAVLDLYVEVAARLDLEAQVHLGLLVAEMEADSLERRAEAVLRLRRLQELAPGSEAVFDLLVRVLTDLGAKRDLVQTLEAEARRAASADRARDLFLRAARVRELELSDPNGAAEALLLLVHRFPEDVATKSEVVRLLDAAGRYADEVRFLEADVYLRPPEERGALRRQIAFLYTDHLGKPDVAERVLRQALAENPDDESSIRLLTLLLERQGAWSSLAEALESLVELVSSIGLRSEMRRKMAELAEKRLSRVDLAVASLEQVLAENPRDLQAVTDLERLFRSLGRWDDVARILELRARAVDGADRARALVEAADIHTRERRDLASARRLLDAARPLAPKDPRVLLALAENSETQQDFHAAVDAWKTLIPLLEPLRRSEVRVRIAKLQEERLGDLAAAAQELEAGLEERPDDVELLASVTRIKRAQRELKSAARFEQRLAELTEDLPTRARRFAQASEAHRESGNAELALQCLEAAADAQPNDPQILAALGRESLTTGRSTSAISRLGAAAKLIQTKDVSGAVELYISAAEAAEAAGHYGEAKKNYESALSLVPKAKKALARLAVLMESASQPARAFELSAALLLHHEQSLAPQEKRETFGRMARTKRALGDHESALRFASKAIEVAKDDVGALNLLAECLREAGRDVEAASAFARVAELAVDDEEVRKPAALAAGRIYTDVDPKKAVAILTEEFSRLPEDQAVAELLARAAERAGDTRRAAHALAEAARAAESEARVELLLRAAGRMVPHDRALSKEWLAEALAESPRDSAAFSTLSVLLENDGEVAALADIHERAGLEYLREVAAQTDEVAKRKLGEHCRTHLQTALDLNRFHAERFEAALAVLDKLKGLDELLGLPSDRLLSLTAKAELLDEAASARGPDAEGKRRRAFETWAEVLELAPGHLNALRRLFALATELRQPRSAAIYAELLIALDEVSKEERKLFESEMNVDPPAPSPGKAMTLAWDEGPLFDLLAELGHKPLAALADALPEPRPKKKDRVEASALGPVVARAVLDAAAILGREVPAIYLKDDASEVVVASWVDDQPALILSGRAERLKASVLRFEIGHALTLLDPKFLAVQALPIEVLREAIEGLVRDRLPEDVLFSDAKKSKKRGKALEKVLPAERREWIATRAEKWLRDPNRVSLMRAKAVADRNAERAGLIASGSLLVATQAIGPRDRRWFHPLVQFACSRAYSSLVVR